MYAISRLAYLDNLLPGETLNECMCKGLREVKLGSSNSDIGVSMCLQSDVVFEQLR